MNKIVWILLFLVLTVSPARSGNLLFVSDDGSDSNIPAALSVDGHTVTVQTDRSVLLGNLNAYHAVFWGASDDGEFDISAVIANLNSYVNAGGYVFVTGADSVASPVNASMLGFVGGSDGKDSGNIVGPVANIVNALTTGVIDIRNQTPPPVGDSDTLCTPLLAGTIGIATSDSNQCVGYAWTLRSLGRGEIAWVSSGNFDNDTDEPDWTSTAIPGDGVYNAAIRNFAYQASLPKVTAAKPVPTFAEWGAIALVALLGMGAVYSLRRRRPAR